MKYVAKKGLQTKHLISIILAVALVLCLVLSILLTHVFDKEDANDTPNESPEIIDGEAIKNGMTLAYLEINTKNQISYISIEDTSDAEKSDFGFWYDESEGCHLLFYVDSDGKAQTYYPEIYYQDSSFSYSSLFATQTMSGIEVTLVDYLCYALQSPFFEERIPFEEDPEKQKTLLEEFGLSEGQYTVIAFSYYLDADEEEDKDAEKQEVQRVIKIGQKSVTGTGFYFIVTDTVDGEVVERPYIYSSLSNYFEYALSNMSKFIKPLIIAPDFLPTRDRSRITHPAITSG